MSADAKQLERATAKLQADHEPRRLNGFTDPRLSVADEEIVVDLAHRRNGQATRTDLAKALDAMVTELEFVKSRLPGDHRGFIREIEHGIKGLKRAV